MTKADQFSFPTSFTGEYPDNWVGYTFLQETLQNALHPGIDWNWGAGNQDFGRPVQVIANGKIVHESRQNGIGYGVITVARHELTDQLYNFIKSRYGVDSRVLYSFYAHQKDEIVSVGQEVMRGDLIGYVGKSGTIISHLHQELYKPIPGTSWRYWPTLSKGWTKEKLQQYYIDTYDLITNQPTTNVGNSDLEECLRLHKELIDKIENDYKPKIRDLTTDNENKDHELEAINSENESFKNFLNQVAEKLGSSPDQAKILGEIGRLISQEDDYRGAINTAKELESKVSELQDRIENDGVIISKAASDKKEVQDAYDAMKTTATNLQRQLDNCEKSSRFKIIGKLFGIYFCTVKEVE